MHRWHVIIKSNPISDMLRANVTIISWGCSVFCLNVVFHNSSARLVSTWQTLPLPPTKIGHHFLQVHCKMKTRQLILMQCIFNESIDLRLFVSSSKMIFKGYFVLKYLGTLGAIISRGHEVLGLDMTLHITRILRQVATLRTLVLASLRSWYHWLNIVCNIRMA